MTTLLKRHPAHDYGQDVHGFFEDFLAPVVSGDLWTPTVADSSSASTLALVLTGTGGKGGILSLTQDATDNDELYYSTSVKSFKIQNGKPLMIEARIQFTELNTSGQNIIFGFMSATGANLLIDDGAGPVASATMAVIYKVDGGTVWRARSQIGAAVGQTDSISGKTAGGASYQTLRVEINPYSSTNAEVIYFVDGEQLKTAAGLPIKHDLVYTNAVEMTALVGCKTGSATAEVLLVDYVSAWQKR